MHSYTIDAASYDGSTPTPDPNQPQADPYVAIHGTVDGVSSGYWAFSWSAIQRAFAFGGVAGVQALFAPTLLVAVTGLPPFVPGPALPNTQINIPAPVTGGPSSVNCVQALVPAWQQ